MTRGIVCLVVLSALGWQSASMANGVAFQDIQIGVPNGWKLHQDVRENETLLLGFENQDQYVRFYAKDIPSLDLREIVAEGLEFKESSQFTEGTMTWDVLRTTGPTLFKTLHHGVVYYGFGTNTESALSFLKGVSPNQGLRSHRSLTGEGYVGVKHYLGWGRAMPGDPSMMHNEVKYDVLHTHDIFTKEIGGSYIGKTMIGNSEATSTAIKAQWAKLNQIMTAEDMYVQYSSGHGSTTGLEVGVTYKEMRDNVLSMAAKEIIVFIMACNSGGLVNAFDEKKSQWQDWQSQGRTLFVMASSPQNVNSSTGPGTDPDQPGGPNGSAGSAFGHALWKALIGYADGHIEGVKDNFLSLQEIHDYTKKRTKEVGGHTPVSTGTYNANLVMNRVPPKEFVEALERGSQGLTDEEVIRQIQELDKAFRVL